MDYKQLKLSGGIPTYDAVQPLLLQILAKETNSNVNNSCKVSLLGKILWNNLKLPNSLRNKYLPSGKKTMVKDRVNWGLSYLKRLGFVVTRSRGYRSITEQGLSFLSEYTTYNSQFKVLDSLQSRVRRLGKLRSRKKSKPVTHKVRKHSRKHVDKLKLIYDQIHAYNELVKEKLLNKIRHKPSTFFEMLVVKVLSKMGYKGPDGKAIVTKPTRDGGVDGVINKDPLGASKIGIQAKRYEASNKVTVHDIRDFYASLKDNHYSQGVFITTSDFTESAVEQAKRFSMVIVNGKRLAHLMLKYGVGAYVKQHYDVYSIDNNLFK